MKISFLTPPSFHHKQPAERSAGCTRTIYPMLNIYELTLAAAVRTIPGADISIDDFSSCKNARDRFLSYACDNRDKIIFIWSVNLSTPDDLLALSILRDKSHKTPVIFAGPAPTWIPQNYLIDDAAFVLRGEPEITAIDLINSLIRNLPLDSIPGLSWRDHSGLIHHNPSRRLITDLDILPFPARDLVADKTFRNPKLKTGPYTSAFTSRNCPYQCSFCVPSSLSFAREIDHRNIHGNKPPVAFRSIRSIREEMEQIVALGYRAVGFMDDNFIWNEQRTTEICDIMRHLGLQWGCQARADAITPAIASMLARSNCRYIDIGVESFDDDILHDINKGVTSAQIKNAIKLLADAGVPVKLNILIGSSPLETVQTVSHTMREVRHLPVDQVMINIVSPFPGTKYHERCIENGWLESGEYHPSDVQRDSILRLPHLSPRQMERLLFIHNIRFFLSPRIIMRHITRFSSPADFIHAFRALKLKLFG